MLADTTQMVHSPRAERYSNQIRPDSCELEEVAGPPLESVLSTHPCADLADCRPPTPVWYVSDRRKAEVGSYPVVCRGESCREEVPSILCFGVIGHSSVFSFSIPKNEKGSKEGFSQDQV